MNDQVVFTSEVGRDIAQSYRWYEEQGPGLGEEFLRCVAACIERIQRNPLMYQLAVADFRRALVRRFPFEVFYEPSDQRIVIYAVFHSSQDPARWFNRLT